MPVALRGGRERVVLRVLQLRRDRVRLLERAADPSQVTGSRGRCVRPLRLDFSLFLRG